MEGSSDQIPCFRNRNRIEEKEKGLSVFELHLQPHDFLVAELDGLLGDFENLTARLIVFINIPKDKGRKDVSLTARLILRMTGAARQ